MSTKTLKTSIQNKIDTESMWEKSTFTSLEGEMFVYRVEGEYTSPRLKFGNGSDVVDVLPFTGGATSVADSPVKTPAQAGTVKYNGSSQSPTWSNYNAAVLDIGGTLSASIPGTYTATFTPKSGYCWEDTLTKEQRSVSWVITNADATITFVDSNNNPVNLTSVELTEVGTAQGFDFEVTGGTVSVQSSNIDYVIASINGFGLWLTPGEENGTATVTLTVTPNQYYNGTTKTITVTNKAGVSSTLGLNSWETISNVAKSGKASSIWEVGDTKSVYINRWESLDSSHLFCAAGDYYVYIVGFNHMPEDNPNTIDFQLYKPTTYASEPPAMLYVDPMNYTSWQDDHSLFCMYTGEEEYEVEIGTSTEQYTRLTGSWEKIYEECLKPGTGWSLYDMLPSELTNVMIKMYPLCNIFRSYYNGNGIGNYESIEISSACYLTLPSVSEVEYSATYTGVIPQYEYYEQGNSAIKYKQNGSAEGYWTRDTQWFYQELFGEDNMVEGQTEWSSPIKINSSGHSSVSSDWNAYYDHSGIAPIFRVGQEI